jgi:hypothetical protein
LVSLATNDLQLGEVAVFERQMFDLAQMFIRTPKLDFSTEPAITQNTCYAQCFLSNKLKTEI